MTGLRHMAFGVLLSMSALDQAVADDITIMFDKVKVTAAVGMGANAGYTVYSVQAIDDGPFKTRNGGGPFEFLRMNDTGRDYLNGYTGATIVANQFDWRYFGSVAATKGSIFTNGTNALFKPMADPPGFKIETVVGKDIGGFEVKLAQPDKDTIKVAEGGNAFKVTIADDKKSATFKDGLLKVAGLPVSGGMGEYLWSFITEAPQPKFPQVMFTEGAVPPDPAGDFKTMRYVGRAVAVVPEPSVVWLSGAGLILVMARRHRKLKMA